jgi:hypothetical protein
MLDGNHISELAMKLWMSFTKRMSVSAILCLESDDSAQFPVRPDCRAHDRV